MDKPRIRISVRNLVEFLLRSGSIDYTASGGTQLLQQGTQIHRRLQKQAGDGYQAEVRLFCDTEFDEFIITVDGIADGIITTEQETIIDEIKSITVPLDRVEEDYSPLHWAQAKCYGWMYLLQAGTEAVTIRLTYYQADTDEVKRFSKAFCRDELQSFFTDLVMQYGAWACMSLNHKTDRDRSIRSLCFPFAEYRKGQRELAAGVYRSIRDKKLLFAQAPTGTGKTISTLFPAVKAMGEGMGEKIFYLTAKAVTRQVAEQAVRIMADKGLVFKSITLTAKEKICPCTTASCSPDECAFACGHYDRVNDAVMDILVNESIITRDILSEYARKHNVCPFEYGLDVSLWVDCIICDYNYVFDPRAYLRRFFDFGGDYTLLIDEAHNLVERAREMYSAKLSKQAFLNSKKVLKEAAPKAHKELVQINKLFIELRKEFERKYDTRTIDLPVELHSHVQKFVEAFEQFLAENKGRVDDSLLDLFFSCKAFLAVYNLYDERYITYVTREDSEVRLKLFCVDPSRLIRKACSKGRMAVFFSGTLQPLSFYKDMLGGEEEDRTMCLISPFPPENLCLMVSGDVSTRYKDRDTSFEAIARYIKSAAGQKNGNYLVFFPSFEYLRNVYELYRSLFPEDYTIIQESRMDDGEREEFLESFDENPSRTMIAFAVMGGIFSEGIDLAGDRLSGAIVVGVGLPQLSAERDLIARYYAESNGQGYEYAYMFPGMNRVLQAAGRVIRTMEDRGFVLLLDDRFLHRRYLNLFPIEWQHYRKVYSPDAVSAILSGFWDC